MNLPININVLIHGKSVEWERLEFKTGWNPLVNDLAKSVRTMPIDKLGRQMNIVALACEKPQDHDRLITHWTAGELSEQAVKEKIVASISARHVSRLLAAIDLQPHRSRYWLNAKADPQKDDKVRAICKVYGQAQDAAARQEFTFSVDEMTDIPALERIAVDQPMQPGQPQRREFEYTRHGTLSLLAGMDVANGKIKAICSPKPGGSGNPYPPEGFPSLAYCSSLRTLCGI